MTESYLNFLKRIFGNKWGWAITEFVFWMTLGFIIAYLINPNSFNNHTSPGWEFLIVLAFMIHGLLRLMYITETK